MSGFEPVELRWKGLTYEIAGHRMMGALQRYERAVLPQDFQLLATGGMAAAPSICASAYGVLLRYAGARVSDDDIYIACRDELWNGETSNAVMDCLLEFQLLRLPPEQREQLRAMTEGAAKASGDDGKPEEEPEPENPTSAATDSSSKPTKSPSGGNG